SDLLLLSSSYQDGICYVETMNLDGETNQKVKCCMECTLCFDDAVKFDKFKATIRCEDPNPSIYSFVGNLELGDEGETSTYPVSPSQILLCDSKLRNTEFVYGVVIFTGRDMKVARNSVTSQAKRSRIDRRMDKVIYVQFFTMLLICLITSIGSAIYTNQEQLPRESWYLFIRMIIKDESFDPDRLVLSWTLQFLRALVLYGYLIPVSLYVSIEAVKVIQGLMIYHDQYLFDKISEKSAEARTSNLNEELGQVEMVLSDKTG
ncbi:probable phospholipid-transporting ATPase 4, partial [Tanacetum coccineum]